MKKAIPFLIARSFLGLSSCHEEDEIAALKKQLTSGRWQKDQFSFQFSPSSEIKYLRFNVDDRDTYSFNENGFYLVESSYRFGDVIYVRGEWSLNPNKKVIDFISKDRVYYTSDYNHSLSDSLLATKFITPTDWKIVEINTSSLKIDHTRADTLLGSSWILKR